jgi:hypothetical protein
MARNQVVGRELCLLAVLWGGSVFQLEMTGK